MCRMLQILFEINSKTVHYLRSNIYYTSQMDSLAYCQWSRGSPGNLMSMGTVSENITFQTLSKWQTNLIY